MQNKGSFLRSALTLIVLFLVFALLLTALNGWAEPKIEQSEASQTLGPLMDVFPGAQGFEPVYNADGSVGGELAVKVENAAGTKCPRCWKHSLTPNAEGLCPRCAEVVRHLPDLL